MALYYKKRVEGGAILAIWRVEESEEQLLNGLSLSKEELKELKEMRSAVKRLEKLSVRALLQTLFNSTVRLAYSKEGAPSIVGSSMKISISHTSKFVSILIHSTKNVGVDIESLNRDFKAVEKKALSDSEREALSDNKSERELQLALYWSAKEALYKKLLIAEVNFSKELSIAPFIPKESGVLKGSYCGKEEREEHFTLHYLSFEEHLALWVV